MLVCVSAWICMCCGTLCAEKKKICQVLTFSANDASIKLCVHFSCACGCVHVCIHCHFKWVFFMATKKQYKLTLNGDLTEGNVWNMAFHSRHFHSCQSCFFNINSGWTGMLMCERTFWMAGVNLTDWPKAGWPLLNDNFSFKRLKEACIKHVEFFKINKETWSMRSCQERLSYNMTERWTKYPIYPCIVQSPVA